MRTILKNLFPVVIFATLCIGCNNNENKDEDIIARYPVDIEVSDYSLDGSPCRWNNQAMRDTLYVINSTEELLNYISCQETLIPPIDFEKHSLLLVGGGTPNWVISTCRHFQQTSINEYVLVIDIRMSMISLPGFWHVAILTPKLLRNVVIEADIKKQY